MKVRFMIAVEVDAPNLTNAYTTLHKQMDACGPNLAWETQDEFYVDGDVGDMNQLQYAIERYFHNKKK